MFVYVLTNGMDYKVGISVNPEKRIKQLQTGNGDTLSLVWTKRVRDRDAARSFERDIHRGLKQCKKEGEWFKLPPEKVSILQREMGY
jgi:predicted GIY-YIG superfamily endonuclease